MSGCTICHIFLILHTILFAETYVIATLLYLELACLLISLLSSAYEDVPSKAQSESGSRGYPPSTSSDTINRESMLVHLVIWQLSLFTDLHNWQLLYRCLFYQVALLCLMLIMVLLVMYILMVSGVNSIEVFLFSYQKMLLHLLRSMVSL